ncbi:MAG: DUF4238 domain-containing protein [Sulfitobacter sp.]
MTTSNNISKKHHYVTQAQLRHFTHDSALTKLFVYDKSNGKSYPSTVKNSGSENHFNTIIEGDERLNFEAMFDTVDGNGANIVNLLNERRSLVGLSEEELLKLSDLGAVQLVRTKLSRETPGVLVRELREILMELGADPDDPTLACPTDTDAKLGTIEAFFNRAEHRESFLRLRPGLVEPEGVARFLISDHPIVFSNPFPYGDHGLQSQGVMVHLPLSPTLLMTWHCPTIVARLDHMLGLKSKDQPALRAYGKGLFMGNPVRVSDVEIERYNALQLIQSRRFVFSPSNNFDAATASLPDQARTEFRLRESLMNLGRMGGGPPPRRGMPDGRTLVVHGPHDHCLLHIEEIDQEGEGITARTSDLELLKAAAIAQRLNYVELYEGPHQRRHLGQVTLELLADRGPGWFAAVHYDESLRALDRQISATRG